MLLHPIKAVVRDRIIRWKAKSQFVLGFIKIDGVDVPPGELKKEGGWAIVPAGKEVLVVRMEARVEELPVLLEQTNSLGQTDSLEQAGEYEAMRFNSIEAVGRDKRITWKARPHFVEGFIRIEGLDIPLEEIKRDGSVIIPSGKSAVVLRMEVKVEEL
jgi:hypothetical protein